MTLGAFGLDFIAGKLKAPSSQTIACVGISAAIFLSLFFPSRKEKFCYPVSMEPVLLELRDLKSMNAAADERLFRLAMDDDNSLVAERHYDATFAKGNPIYNRMVAIQPHMNASAHIVTVDGYEEGLVPTARMKDFLYAFNRNFRQQRPDVTLLTLLGVRPIYTELPIDPSVYTRSKKFSSPVYFENAQWRGAAFWADDVKDIDFARLDGPWWRKEGGPLPEIQREAIALGALPETWSGAPFTTTYPTLNSVSVGSAGTPPRGDAILCVGWYPGWKLRMYKTDVPLEFVSAVHAKLPTTAMVSDSWRLFFRPFSYRLGLFLSALGAGLWCALLCFSAVRRSRLSLRAGSLPAD